MIPSDNRSVLAARLVQRFVAVIAMGRRVKNEETLAIPGLDKAAFALLMHLSHGEMRVGALAEACHIDLSTTSRHATALTRLGLVTKVPDPEDRRAQLLTLTPAGVDLVTSIRQMRGQLFADILADWSEDDLGRFDAYLARFVNDVERHLQSQNADENQQGNH